MIEVGEYVRTDNGEIHRVIDIEKGSIKIKSQYIHLYYDFISLYLYIYNKNKINGILELNYTKIFIKI